MANYTVFYGTQVVGEFHKPQDIKQEIEVSSDIYQSGYVYWKNAKFVENHWYRLDFTPVLIEDVPKALRAMVLILNL